MQTTRKQLTLFLDQPESILIEDIRKKYNPEQHRLIKSHITLCREDEIEDLEVVLNNLINLKFDAFELTTEPIERFSAGKGVFIPILDEQGIFKKLRASVLKHTIGTPRVHQPHITMMHPRNSTCTDVIFETLMEVEFPTTVKISSICLIEQEIGQVWKVLREFKATPLQKSS